VAVKVILDAKLPRQLKYSRATEVFIQWRDPDTRQVYGLTFLTKDAADGFQQWLDYAVNPPPAAAAPARSTPVAAVHATVSPASSSEESHYQRPPPRPAPSKQQPSNGPDIVESHQTSVYTDICCITTVNGGKTKGFRVCVLAVVYQVVPDVSHPDPFVTRHFLRRLRLGISS